MRVVRDGVIQWLEGEYAGCVGGLPEGGTFWIGSGEGCDIPLYGADIAPYHLGIACDSEYDGFFVMCFEPDSVFLENGTPLLPEQEQWIPSGTILILGSGRNRICPVREGEDGEFIPEGEEPRRGAGKKIALAAGLVCAVVLLGVGAWKLGFLNGGFGTSLAGMEEEEETDSEETEYTPQPEKTIQYAEDCVVYRPADEALAYDEDTCTIYYNNVLAVYLTEEITDEAKTALANAVGGKIVGEMSGSIDLMQIQVPESDLAQLNSYAESLKDAEYVMCATYEVPMILSETETYADQNPWADPTDDDYEKKVQAGIEGNEEEPQGNNWWAEAIGAYTAWNCEFERQPMTVAVIDTGFYLSNEDLQGKITMLNDNTGDDHGTHVAGLIAATDNTVGIRGVADQVQILGIDWRDEDTGSMFSDCDIVAWIKMAIENGAKVTNLSLGITYPTDYQYYSEIHGELWAIVSYLEDFGYGL